MLLKDRQKEKLIKLLWEADSYAVKKSERDNDDKNIDNYRAEFLLQKGVSVPLAVVGDDIYVFMVKKPDGEGRGNYSKGFQATSPAHLNIDAEIEITRKICVKNDIQLIGRLAFPTVEEAEAALRKARRES